jgi:urease accessory protein
MDARALLHLLHLSSPALPIGAYAYSQGLESAVHAGAVRDEASARAWIVGLLEHAQAQLDVPVLARLHAALESGDAAALERWTAFLAVSRESRELQDEDRALGRALARLLADLDVAGARALAAQRSMTLAAAFALAAVAYGIPLREAASGYLFAWLENQVAAAVRLVPLGQTSGRRVLLAGIAAIPAAVERGLALDEDSIGAAAPGLAALSARHESQYTRLFRS